MQYWLIHHSNYMETDLSSQHQSYTSRTRTGSWRLVESPKDTGLRKIWSMRSQVTLHDWIISRRKGNYTRLALYEPHSCNIFIPYGLSAKEGSAIGNLLPNVHPSLRSLLSIMSGGLDHLLVYIILASWHTIVNLLLICCLTRGTVLLKKWFIPFDLACRSNFRENTMSATACTMSSAFRPRLEWKKIKKGKQVDPFGLKISSCSTVVELDK